MNALITRVTSPGFRKYCYRVAWAAALVLIACGKLDAGQLQVVLGLVAAVLAVADSQTEPDTLPSQAVAPAPVADDTAPGWTPVSQVPDEDIKPLED